MMQDCPNDKKRPDWRGLRSEADKRLFLVGRKATGKAKKRYSGWSEMSTALLKLEKAPKGRNVIARGVSPGSRDR
jgi:hypothetical protein